MGAPLNLVGKRFGRLTVCERLGANERKEVIWRCRCDCGEVIETATRNLRSRGTISCGCARREKSERNLTTISIETKLKQIDGTNLSRLRSERPQANNTIGVRGVSQIANGKYLAYVYYRRRRINAGVFTSIEEAGEAVKRLREAILVQYQETDE